MQKSLSLALNKCFAFMDSDKRWRLNYFNARSKQFCVSRFAFKDESSANSWLAEHLRFERRKKAEQIAWSRN